MRFINEAQDAEYYAEKVKDTAGVYLVPAFTGLGAPYWDMYARGVLIGITRGTKREHISPLERDYYKTKQARRSQRAARQDIPLATPKAFPPVFSRFFKSGWGVGQSPTITRAEGRGGKAPT